MNDIEVAKTELFMAKDAEDREDLLRDATAYVARIEFNIPMLITKSSVASERMTPSVSTGAKTRSFSSMRTLS